MSTKGFILELRPTGKDDRPAEVRLRGFLKLALRAFGFQCVSVRWSKDDDAAGPQHKLTPRGPTA